MATTETEARCIEGSERGIARGEASVVEGQPRKVEQARVHAFTGEQASRECLLAPARKLREQGRFDRLHGPRVPLEHP